MPYLYGSDPRADEPARGGAGGDAETDGSGYEGDGSTPPPSNEGDTARDGSSGGSVGGIDLCCGGRSGGGGGISSSSGGGGGSSSGGGGGDDIIRVSWALGTPGCGWVWEMPVMPNEEWPSDHLAVGVELVLVGSKRALPLKP
ncbi:hypothetical protein Vafri_7993 [Volvox africanus]|uniref:Uncharacterized protein n=2 Tax=Volvox africanus TaxID=51714 RepID=A0A8J4B2Z9_9CHLO|nr:hypothetical protein Vafri_7993 [Volvox africanus]